MPVELRRVDPLQMREAIVDFFWRIRMWPLPTKEHYFRLWDWRQKSLSEQTPAVWVALDGGTVVGHLTVLFRNLSCNGELIRAGVTANFRVDASRQAAPMSAALATAPRTLVRRGEVDLLLGFSSSTAHGVAVALGNRPLGPMHTLIDIWRWKPILQRRSRVFGAFASLASATARARKFLRRARVVHVHKELSGRLMSADELAGLDRSHWQHGGGLTWDGSLASFGNHFCQSEFRASRVLGITDRRTGRLEGVVALEGLNNLQILECAVNESALSSVQAVAIAVRAHPRVESVRVPVLPHTKIAAEFRDAGYYELPVTSSAALFRDTFWSAYWDKEHRLAAALADTGAWNLWYGWSHH